MPGNPYEPKGFDKWGPEPLLLRALSELFGSGRKRWLAEQAEKAGQAEREEGRTPPPDDS